MFVLHYIVTLLINFASAQFPDHIDLQKIKEVTHKNEKYNILKPTVHKITDYFEEFMLRSESRNDEKIFIDNDGFRHFWSGVGLKPKSHRKTDIKLYEINKNSLATTNEDDDDTKSSSEEGIKIPILRQARAKPTATAAKPKATTAKPKATTAKPKATTAKPIATTAKPKPVKVATTSFFCPFLGVIKMTSIID